MSKSDVELTEEQLLELDIGLKENDLETARIILRAVENGLQELTVPDKWRELPEPDQIKAARRLFDFIVAEKSGLDH